MERFGVYGNSVLSAHFSRKTESVKKKKGCLGWPQILGSGHQQHRCPQDSGAHREALVGPRSGLRAAHKRPVGARIPDSGPHGSSLGGGGQRGALWRLSPGQLGVRTVLVKDQDMRGGGGRGTAVFLTVIIIDY